MLVVHRSNWNANLINQYRFYHLSGWWWSVALSIAMTGLASKAMLLPHDGHSTGGHGWLLMVAALLFGIQALLITPWQSLQAESYGLRKSPWQFGPLILGGASLLVVFVCVAST